MSDFIQMTKNSFDIAEMRTMECKVLTVIEFEINCCPSQTFLENYSRAICVSEPRVLIYASYLLDIALIKYDFLRFKTSHLTVCALAIAMHRDEKLSKQNYQDKLSYLQEIMEIEGYDQETFTACKRQFDAYRYVVVNNQAYQSIRRKYANVHGHAFDMRDDANTPNDSESPLFSAIAEAPGAPCQQ